MIDVRQVIKVAAECSLLAYDIQTKSNPLTNQPIDDSPEIRYKPEILTTINIGNVQAFAAEFQIPIIDDIFIPDPTIERLHVISICGTNELSDWFDSKDLNTIHLDGVGYHGGFYSQAYQLLRELLSSSFNWLTSDPFETELIITGHSLGHGVAGCLLPMLPQRMQDRLSLAVTFGGPRFLKSNFAWRYPFQNQFISFANERDLIPDYPLNTKILPTRLSGWSNPGIVTWLTVNGPKIDPSVWWQFQRKFIRRLRYLRLLFPSQIPQTLLDIADTKHHHSMRLYRDRIFNHYV